jgi:hypothetical protein
MSARTCNGTGTCSAATSSTCPGGFNCDTAMNVCKITCTTSADCVAPSICNGGVCSAKPLGAACTAGTECASSFCQQGVCCGSTCTGTCKSCAIPGATTLGTCSNVTAGQKDSLDRCPTTAASTCMTDGTCDGAGACHLHPLGTQCVAGACSGSTLTPVRTCDGIGNCLMVTTAQCNPFLCNTNGTCKNSCTPATSAADCVAPNVCTGTSCGKRPTGTACTATGDCESNFCVESVCCDKACNGTCQSCAVAGKVGTCSQLGAGVRPVVASQCMDQGVMSCGTDGTCDGNAGCRRYASGTVCVAGSCSSGSTQTLPRACNGTGTCQAATMAACPGGFFCNTTSSVCKTSCTIATSAADCVAPNVCTGTICGVLKLQYQTSAATGMTTNSPHPWFQIVNLGTAVVPLSELTIRYWYTSEGAPTQAAVVDFASNSANMQIQGSVTSAFIPVTRTGANTYLQFGFLAAAGNLNANGGIAVVQSRFNSTNPDFAVIYTQTNDYSFDATKTAFADWTHVTLYRAGTLVWGIEPPSM